MSVFFSWRKLTCSHLQYCEFGGTTEKCREWLEGKHPEMFERVYGSGKLSISFVYSVIHILPSILLDIFSFLSTVPIKLVERSKRKHATVIGGLEAFIGPDGVKKAAKELGKKFAAGASVTKSVAGGDEVVVQGDVVEEVEEWIEEKYEGVVPEG